jgi:hypothetical protein
VKISHSRLQTFARCPESYRIKYELGVRGKNSGALAYGVILHYAIQLYHETGRNYSAAKAAFLHYWDNPDQMGVEVEYYLPRTSWSGYRDHGTATLEEYHKAYTTYQKDEQIIASEVGFEVPVGQHELVGFIDQIRIVTDKRGRRSLNVADLKTGKVPKALRWNQQFTCYVYALGFDDLWNNIEDGDRWREETKDLPITTTWIDLKSIPFREVDGGTRTQADFHRLEKAIEAFGEAVDKKIFVPILSGETCTFCDFQKECGLPDNELVAEEFEDQDKLHHEW